MALKIIKRSSNIQGALNVNHLGVGGIGGLGNNSPKNYEKV